MGRHRVKMMKNAFYFTCKAFLFFLRDLIFYPDFFCHVGKRLDQKANVNFKIYDVATGKLIMTMHQLPKISRSKGSQTRTSNQYQHLRWSS